MKLFWLVMIVLAAPIVPVLVLGVSWQHQLADSTEQVAASSRPLTALAIGVLLAADIFLPVPSGPLATIAGARLGFFPAVAVVWVGLLAGAALGFAIARRWGRPMARRWAGSGVLEQLERTFENRSATMLLVTRPLPILAEAAVLLAGVSGVSWRRFFAPVAGGSLLFAGALAATGRYAEANELSTIAITLTAVLPIVATAWLRRRWSSSARSKPHVEAGDRRFTAEFADTPLEGD